MEGPVVKLEVAQAAMVIIIMAIHCSVITLRVVNLFLELKE